MYIIGVPRVLTTAISIFGAAVSGRAQARPAARTPVARLPAPEGLSLGYRRPNAR